MLKDLNLPKMATIKETAEIFNLAKHYVRQLVIQRKIKYIKAGRKVLINVQKFADFLNECPNEQIKIKENRFEIIPVMI